MEYRKLPHGTERERFSVLGLGMGGIQNSSDAEIEETIKKAIESGINFFDLCAGARNVYEPFGRAIKGRREQVFLQMHLGAVYNQEGAYAWSRNLREIIDTFTWELKVLGTDYADMGFLHCVDEDKDYEDLVRNGVFDYLKECRKNGSVRHMGFSSHTPSVANKIIDTGLADMMMFSINPAYDLEKGDSYGIGSAAERMNLFRRCEAEGIGISVMKAFHGGQLLDAKTSPFSIALTKIQCIQYAADRPGVLSVLPGVRNRADLESLLPYVNAGPGEKDYSIIGEFTPAAAVGHCVYCNHCKPCPGGIDVGLVNKYYDLALAGDDMAANHYDKLSVKADACIACGHCDKRCPFGVSQSERMKEIRNYFR